MMVVAIIGILAAVALPAFVRYVKQSKTTQALASLRQIFDSQIAYYNKDITHRSGTIISNQFVGCSRTPASIPAGTRVLADWSAAYWRAINFAMGAPTAFSYSVVTAGVGSASSFSVRAEGDLDGDNSSSLFERAAIVNSATGDVQQASGLYQFNVLE